ncbi:MAG: O-antigen ligase family protein [bacterium]
MPESSVLILAPSGTFSVRYQRTLAVLTVLVFFSGVTVWSFDTGLSPLAPNRWLALFAAMSLPLMGPRHFVALARAPLFRWAGAYLAITAAWVLVGDPGDIGVVQAQYRLFAVAFLTFALVVFADPCTHIPARRAMAACVVMNALLNVYDLTHPLAFSRDIGRAAGLYVNANISGAALVLGILLSFGVLRGLARHAFVIVGVVGVLATQSRSAALTLVVALLVLTAGGELRVLRLAGVALVAIVIGVAGLWLSGQLALLAPLVSSGELLQLTRLTSTSGDASVGDFYSTQSRLEYARAAWTSFTNYPLLGGGIGTSGYTHNMYLMHLADHGVLGLFIYPSFVLAAFAPFRGPDRRMLAAAALALGVWGLFSHNALEEMHTLLAAALGASLSRLTVEAPTPDVDPHRAGV